MSEMGRNICEEERCKKVDAQRISPSERGGREGRTGKKRHEQKNGEDQQHVTEFKEDPMFEQSGDD